MRQHRQELISVLSNRELRELVDPMNFDRELIHDRHHVVEYGYLLHIDH